ncbi:MAG: tetratricopeptide repeat protein [Steroidobacteraceae bacterium]
MTKLVRVCLLAVLTLGMASVAAAAAAATDATPDQIYQAAQSGHLVEAQQMVDQVLRDHPQNAKAHFFAAELDARMGDFNAAREQLASARQLDPSQSFTNRQSLNALQRQLTGMRTVVPLFAPAVQRSAVPWGLIMVLAIGAFVVFNIFRRRAQPYAQGYGPGLLPPGNPGMQSGYGYGPGYAPGGTGLMGNLASGLAIGAGVVAGEELVRHVIDGNSSSVPPTADLRDPAQNQDMGGADFGTQDGGSWGNDSSGGDAGGWGGDSGGGGDWS